MDRKKYKKLIDREMWAYIDLVDGWFPPDAAAMPIAEQRAIYDRMCGEFHSGYPAGISVADERIEAPGRVIPFRRYRTNDPMARAAIVYFHGGGFILGGLDSHDDICAELCAGTGFDVISVDYRLAPEHVHPAAFEDARAAFDHLADTIDPPILLCGESAGGNLAAAVAHATRRANRPAVGQVLIYPGLGGDVAGSPYTENVDAPLLSVGEIEFYRQIRTGGAKAVSDPTLDPLCADDFSGLPPTVVFAAQYDPLAVDGKMYCDRINAAGGRARCHEDAGLIHSYLRARHTAQRAGEAFSRIIAAAGALGRNEWPYSDER